MANEINDQEETGTNHTKENLESIGQIIAGELEAIGGIITADGLARAEGDYTADAGILHQESNKVLTAIDKKEEGEHGKPDQNRTKE